MRLIDKDALIEFIENRYSITWKNDYEGGIKDACTDILEKISNMPTIEPERKKGSGLMITALSAVSMSIMEICGTSARSAVQR